MRDFRSRESHTRACKTYQDASEDSHQTASAEEARRVIVGDPDTRPLDPGSSSTDPNPKRSKTTSVTDNENSANQMKENNFRKGPATSHQSTMKTCRRKHEWQETFFTFVAKTV